MNTFPRLIEGVVEDPQTPRVRELEGEIRKLERERDDALRDAERAKDDTNRALAALRRQLSPLYRALQAVFGELDAAGVGDVSVPSAGVASTSAARWDEWKQRLGSSCAKVIDLLLLAGTDGMTVTAMSTTGRMAKQTVYDATSKMGRAGILVNNGGRFSLKQL